MKPLLENRHAQEIGKLAIKRPPAFLAGDYDAFADRIEVNGNTRAARCDPGPRVSNLLPMTELRDDCAGARVPGIRRIASVGLHDDNSKGVTRDAWT
jgi:hypothetical protein